MKIEDVLKMIDAGFTSEEIRGMITPAADPAPAPAAEPTPSADDPAPAADPAAAEAAAQPGLDAITALNTILGKMNAKLDQMQQANIYRDASSAGGQEQPTADDITRDLIFPGSTN